MRSLSLSKSKMLNCVFNWFYISDLNSFQGQATNHFVLEEKLESLKYGVNAERRNICLVGSL